MPGDRHRSGVEPVCAEPPAQSDDPLTDLLRGLGRVRSRPPGAGLQSVQAALAVENQEAMQVATGEPLLSSGLRDRQLARGNLENSNASTRHARQGTPPGGGAR